ncbi:MAG: YHS domain-containing protein [Nitrospinae bacterium]|nr:YHS domain-containing protein [Nitrospinota bacterium]MBI3815326.1 YHS domain-containing protein [Nitrospinota bacterium]
MRQIIILILLSLIIYIVKKSFRQPLYTKKENPKWQAGENMIKDPVCNIYIPESEAVKKVIGGKTVFFCSNECADKFEKFEQ